MRVTTVYFWHSQRRCWVDAFPGGVEPTETQVSRFKKWSYSQNVAVVETTRGVIPAPPGGA